MQCYGMVFMLSNYIFENSKEEIIKGFSDLKEQNEILFFYRKYLNRIYASTVRNEFDFEKYKDKFLKYELSKWVDVSKSQKQSLLIEDEFLDRLGYLSDLGLKYAIAKIKGEPYSMTPVQARKYISEMNLLVNKVLGFNSNLAQTYLSEGTIDFMYASGLSDKMSLRVGRIK